MTRHIRRKLAIGAAFAVLLGLGAAAAALTAGAEPTSVQQTVSTTVTTGTTTVSTSTTTTAATTTTGATTTEATTTESGGGGGGGGGGGTTSVATTTTVATTTATTATTTTTTTGGGGGAACSNPTSTVQVGMFEYRFDFSVATVPAGCIQFVITNRGSEPHNFDLTTVKAGAILAPGGTETWAVQLTAKSYVVVCDVPFHIDRGMTAQFVVT
jgi:uncharacterized cupredoxin-like copper-binding protein